MPENTQAKNNCKQVRPRVDGLAYDGIQIDDLALATTIAWQCTSFQGPRPAQQSQDQYRADGCPGEGDTPCEGGMRLDHARHFPILHSRISLLATRGSGHDVSHASGWQSPS